MYEPDASVMRDAMRKGEALRAAAEQQRMAVRRPPSLGGPTRPQTLIPSPPGPHDAAEREWRAAAAVAVGGEEGFGLGSQGPGGGAADGPLPYAVVAPPLHAMRVRSTLPCGKSYGDLRMARCHPASVSCDGVCLGAGNDLACADAIRGKDLHVRTRYANTM